MRVLQRIITATLITSTLFGNLQSSLAAAELQAGAAKVDITNMDAGPVEIPLYARALALKSEDTTVVVITLDVVSFGMIGSMAEYGRQIVNVPEMFSISISKSITITISVGGTIAAN